MKKSFLVLSLICSLPSIGEKPLRYVAHASQNEAFCTPVSNGGICHESLSTTFAVNRCVL